MKTDIVERLNEFRAKAPSISAPVSALMREAAETIATLRREVEQANADCKRANETTNAAIDDYNAVKAELKHARAKALEKAAEVVVRNIIMNTHEGKELRPRGEGNVEGLAYAAAIRSLADKEG